MAMVEEFKKFISQGNVLDLAVGVIIGGAFGKIVNSLVADIFMPLIGLATGGVSFSQRFIALNGQSYETMDAAKTAGAAVLAYGNFIQVSIDFLCIAFCLFIVVKVANKYRKPAEAPVK